MFTNWQDDTAYMKQSYRNGQYWFKEKLQMQWQAAMATEAGPIFSGSQ
jgi:hypothetical protein